MSVILRHHVREGTKITTRNSTIDMIFLGLENERATFEVRGLPQYSTITLERNAPDLQLTDYLKIFVPKSSGFSGQGSVKIGYVPSNGVEIKRYSYPIDGPEYLIAKP